MSGDTIGMMEGAFFVSKGVILEWMNDLLDVSNHTDLISNYSFNSPKLSNAPLELSTAKLWMQSIQELLISAKSSGEQNSTTSMLRITKSFKMHLTKMVSKDI